MSTPVSISGCRCKPASSSMCTPFPKWYMNWKLALENMCIPRSTLCLIWKLPFNVLFTLVYYVISFWKPTCTISWTQVFKLQQFWEPALAKQWTLVSKIFENRFPKNTVCSSKKLETGFQRVLQAGFQTYFDFELASKNIWTTVSTPLLAKQRIRLCSPPWVVNRYPTENLQTCQCSPHGVRIQNKENENK